ncbi:M50 family metallopeptidase [Phytohabitans sp. LJ34]|uniref:M50 family metallopeptidase n=1 Tax=Phytohabitans sp. LJ34 TaxID=3452217 RepID=UPI003F8B06AF
MPLAAAVTDADPARVVVLAAVIAWVGAVPMFVVTKYAATVAHEGGHALLGRLLAQKVVSIRLERGGNAATSFGGKLPWAIDVPVTMMGHLGPSVFGLGAAWLAVRGYTAAVFWASLAFLVLMLFVVRGPVGWLVVPALVVLAFLAAVYTEPPTQALLAHVWAWFLLIAAVEQSLVVMRGGAYATKGSDHDELRRLTLLPPVLWGLLLLTGSVAALAYGGAMLLRLG